MADLQEIPLNSSESARLKKQRKFEKEFAKEKSQDKIDKDGKKKRKKSRKESADELQSNNGDGSIRRASESRRNSTHSSDQQKARLDNEDEDDSWKNPEASTLTPKISRSMEDMGEGAEEDYLESLPPFSATEKDKEEISMTSGKPQIWIRLRPSPKTQDNLFDMTDDGKGVIMQSTLHEASPNSKAYRSSRQEQGFHFACDGVLRHSSQEDTYQKIAHDLIGKAMEGVSGLIVSVGPEVSGKNFTLFGSTNKFQYRGIIPRSLERIFQIVAAKSSEMRYLIRMAIVEVRNDKIRDLLTLGSYEGHSFDKEAANGMIFQKIGASEHGFGLLIRALTCQKELHREPYAKPHTVVFVDIYGESISSDPSEKPRIVKSRVTFAKTAPIPERDVIFPPPAAPADCMDDCCGKVTVKKNKKYDFMAESRNPKCGSFNGGICQGLTCAKAKVGPVAEAIRIRQDLGFLEQMCSRAFQYQRYANYYARAYSDYPGFYIPPPRSQLFRLSKLTYCLKDIVSGNSEIRVLLHIRPERRYKHASLEAMRFAEKAKAVPFGIKSDSALLEESEEGTQAELAFSFNRDEMTMKDFLKKLPPEVSDMYIQVLPGTFSSVREHAGAVFGGKVHGVEEIGESQVQSLFEKFQTLWTYVMDTGSLPGNSFPPQSVDFPPITETPREPTEVVEVPQTTSTKRLKSSKSKSSGKKSREDKIKLKKSKSSKRSATDDGIEDPPKLQSTADILGTDSKIPTPDSQGFTLSNNGSQTSLKVVEPEKALEGDSAATVPEVEPAALDELKMPVLESREAPSKEEAWAEFLSSEMGAELEKDIKGKSKTLQDTAMEHNELIKQTSALMNRLNNHQVDLNLTQQERFLKGDEYDATGNIIIGTKEKQIIQEMKLMENSRTQATERIKEVRARLQFQKSAMEASKLDAEMAFQTFALENYSTAYDGIDKLERSIALTSEARPGDAGKDDDQERIRKFEEIKRVAKKQARFFLRALAKKPSWVPY